MFTTLIIVLSVLGVLVGIADKYMPDGLRAKLGTWDSAAHGWFERVKEKPLAEWMRGRRSLNILLAFILVVALPIGYLKYEGDGIMLGILAVSAVLMFAAVWFLGRAGSNWAFAGRFVLVLVLFVVGFDKALIFAAGGPNAMLGNEEDDLALFSAIYSAMLVLSLFIPYFLLMLLPFLIASLLVGFSKLAEGYYRYCLLNNKLPTMLVFVVLGGLASIYKTIHG